MTNQYLNNLPVIAVQELHVDEITIDAIPADWLNSGINNSVPLIDQTDLEYGDILLYVMSDDYTPVVYL